MAYRSVCTERVAVHRSGTTARAKIGQFRSFDTLFRRIITGRNRNPVRYRRWFRRDRATRFALIDD
jgi:hypothetical protein